MSSDINPTKAAGSQILRLAVDENSTLRDGADCAMRGQLAFQAPLSLRNQGTYDLFRICWPTYSTLENAMVAHVKTGVAFLGGFTIGALATQALQAQAMPPAYIVSEITVKDADSYAKEFLPARTKAVQAAGGAFVVRGGHPKAVAGEAPQRVAIVQFENMDRLIAFTRTAAFRDSEAIGEKYANFRIFAVEGVPK